MTGNRRLQFWTSSSDGTQVELDDLRSAALSALAAGPSVLTIDLRDVDDAAEAVSALHDIQVAARGSHCRLEVALPKLTIHLDHPPSIDD